MDFPYVVVGETICRVSFDLEFQFGGVECRRGEESSEKAKYGHVACAPGGCNSSLLTFHHPDLPGFTFMVHWSVDVSKEGEVTPKVDLLTKIPDRALQLFSSQAVGGAAEAFRSLLRLLGPEAALEEVIRAAGLIADETHDDGNAVSP